MSATELLLRGGHLVDVQAGRIVRGDVLVRDGRIAAVIVDGRAPPAAARVLDVSGRFVAPGFIDSHLHIESSLLSPLEFARRAVEHGTTTVFVDPHEIANVQGRRGIALFLEHAARAPLDIFIGIPSCVPATTLEDSGATIALADVEALLDEPRVYGLAEMMNFPGIVHGLGEARAKVDAVLARGKRVDGHAPALSGADLRAYISNGRNDGVARITHDHECTTAAEALEKLAGGMSIALRHGSAAKDLPRVLPGLLAARPGLERVMLCSDDLDPVELHADGHVERIVRAARAVLLDAGEPFEAATVRAIALATLHTAAHYAPFFRLHGHPLPGAIAAGRAANLVVLRSLQSLQAETVVHAGRVVVEQGRCVEGSAQGADAAVTTESGVAQPGPLAVARRFAPEDFALRCNGGRTTAEARVIGLAPGIWTEALRYTLPVRGGALQLDERTAKLAVVERHHRTGTFAVGLVERRIRAGAIASTVAHDSHNIIAMGVDDAALATAVNHLAEHGGGLVVVGDGIEYFPLEIGGLMSARPLPEVVAGYTRIREAVQRIGGDAPLLMRLSFLALPVIPALRLTNRGLVDVNAFDFVPVV
jgi:adenine deaminase